MEFKTRKIFITTALKSQLVKENTKTKLYDYSEFNVDDFKAELDDKLKSGIVTEHSNFKNIYIHKFSIVMLQQRKKCVSIIAFSWLKPYKRLLCTDLDWKIYISLKEMIEIGKSIRIKEIFVLTFFVKVEQNTWKI